MGKASHTYTAFGLNFVSTIPLPELGDETDGAPDVTIGYGEVPEALSSASDFGIAWQADAENHLLTISEVARYLVRKDREVIIDPMPGATEADIRVFLLGSVLGAILHTRKMLVLHSSAIETRNGAVLFMGDSGMGKSTTLGAFVKRGYSMLADDKACITLNRDGVAQVIPSFPTVKLTKEAVDKLEFKLNGLKPGTGIGKYVIPVKRFCDKPRKVHRAYLLRQHNIDEVVLKSLDSFSGFEALNSSTYRRKFIHTNERRLAHFRMLGVLSAQTSVTEVSRPVNKDLIKQVVDRIEEDLGK